MGGPIEFDDALGAQLVNLSRPEDDDLDTTMTSRRPVLVMGLKYNKTYRFGICLVDTTIGSGTHENRVQMVPSSEHPIEQPHKKRRIRRPRVKVKVATIQRALEVALTWFRSSLRPGASSPGVGVGDPPPADYTTVMMGDFGVSWKTFQHVHDTIMASLSRELRVDNLALQICGTMMFPAVPAYYAPFHRQGCIARVRVVY